MRGRILLYSFIIRRGSADQQTEKITLPLAFPTDAVVILLDAPTKEYSLKNAKTAYDVCRGHSRLPPDNDLNELFENEHT